MPAQTIPPSIVPFKRQLKDALGRAELRAMTTNPPPVNAIDHANTLAEEKINATFDIMVNLAMAAANNVVGEQSGGGTSGVSIGIAGVPQPVKVSLIQFNPGGGLGVTINNGVATIVNNPTLANLGLGSAATYSSTAFAPSSLSADKRFPPNPSAMGNVLYDNGTNWVVLAPGTSGYVLTTNGAGVAPTWTPSSGGSSYTGTAPIVITGTVIGINAATDLLPGSMSAADKTKLDGLGGTGSLAYIINPLPSTLSISTEGTLDWYAVGQTGFNTPRARAPGAVNAKISGGWILTSFDWSGGGGGSNSGSIMATTSSAGDDLSSTPLSSDTGQAWVSISSGTGVGFRLRVPADTYQRVLRLYLGVWSGVATITASLTDGSAATITPSLNSGAAADLVKQVIITYKSAASGQELVVTALLTTNYGSTPNVAFFAATLAPT